MPYSIQKILGVQKYCQRFLMICSICRIYLFGNIIFIPADTTSLLIISDKQLTLEDMLYLQHWIQPLLKACAQCKKTRNLDTNTNYEISVLEMCGEHISVPFIITVSWRASNACLGINISELVLVAGFLANEPVFSNCFFFNSTTTTCPLKLILKTNSLPWHFELAYN